MEDVRLTRSGEFQTYQTKTNIGHNLIMTKTYVSGFANPFGDIEFEWVCKNGKKVYLSEMETSHLINAFKLVLRTPRLHEALPFFKRELNKRNIKIKYYDI